MKLRLILAFLLTCLGSVPLWAGSTPSPALLVLAKQDHTLEIVDPATLQVVTKIPAGNDPHEVIASADGRLAYISNYGGAYNTISVADLAAQKALAAIAASTAEPPAFRISTPASEARAWGQATIPRGASVGGRPMCISIMEFSFRREKGLYGNTIEAGGQCDHMAGLPGRD